MSQAVTRYSALYDSLAARRRRKPVPTGLDAVASQIATTARHWRVRRRWLERQAAAIETLAPDTRGASERALAERIAEVREVFVRTRADRVPDEAVRRAMALVREVARRETGEEPFHVQLMGALALYHGQIIEMVTGEGKTLTGSLVAPLLAWRHRHVHVLTVNDYLARRDAESRRAIYRRCLTAPMGGVGAIQQEMDHAQRAEVYALPIVYGTPKQITADWLRDQLRLGPRLTPWAGRQGLVLGRGLSWSAAGETAPTRAAGPLIPGLSAAIVDEADAVLIDEGVVPLIIARARREDEMGEVYRTAASIAGTLNEGPDYSIDHVRRRAELRARGRRRCQDAFDALDQPIWRARRRAEELVRQALVARHCYRHGHQYQIVDGRVVIVDEYTGRFLPDRSWEHGLHQAVEAKEGLSVTADRETLARMSFQRFFRSYPFLCGMTGTAADATVEMRKIYARPITIIPTNRPVVRERWPTRVFRSAEGKWAAIVAAIEQVHAIGRPVLVGTRSIEASELLSARLEGRGMAHRVLNANFDKEEADLIAQAGEAGSITVATNMAGRGTDIVLDARARELGGLHVLLTEMHTAKRIDRQFIGRAGRQGDPGSAQVFVALDDELVRHHARAAAYSLARANLEELRGPRRRSALALFRLAQRRAERRARIGRAGVLRQDDWIDKYLPLS